MPYIKQADRTKFLDILYSLPTVTTPGELNFILTYICKAYITGRGASYATFNEVIGVLECAKLEMYRRSVAPYEDTKIEENGDVN